MKIEKTLSKMYPGTSKLVIELVVEYALRCAHAEISAESLIEVQNACHVSMKHPVPNMDETALDYEIRCYGDKNLSNSSAAGGMLYYAQKTGGILVEHDINQIWVDALTAARDMLSVLV